MKPILGGIKRRFGGDKQVKASKLRQTVLAASAVAVGLLGVHSGAQAVTFTLQELVDGGSITVGDKLFDQWRVTENSIVGDVTGRTAVDLANILVTDLPSNPLNPGLSFTTLNNALRIDQAGTTPTADLDLDFVFRVSAPDPLIKDNSLVAFFDGTDPDEPGLNFLPDHEAEVRERLFKDAALTDPVIDLGGLPIEKDVHLLTDVSSGDFEDESGLIVMREFEPLQELFVLKDVRVLTASQGEFAEILSFDQHFSQVPEPGTIILFGSGLLGLGLIRRRRQRTAQFGPIPGLTSSTAGGSQTSRRHFLPGTERSGSTIYLPGLLTANESALPLGHGSCSMPAKITGGPCLDASWLHQAPERMLSITAQRGCQILGRGYGSARRDRRP